MSSEMSHNQVKLFSLDFAIQNMVLTVLVSAQILQRLSFVEDSLENSKLFRITFGEAVMRGTQFRVESFLYAEARR